MPLIAPRARTSHAASSRPAIAPPKPEHQALEQELADQSTAGRAQRRTDRKLGSSLLPSREHRGRHIRAGDQQDEGDGAEQQEQRIPRAVRQLVLQPDDNGADRVVVAAVLLLQLLRDRVQLGARGWQRHAALDARHDVEVVPGTAAVVGEELLRHPHVGVSRICEPFGHHADDPGALAADDDAKTGEVGLAAERSASRIRERRQRRERPLHASLLT